MLFTTPTQYAVLALLLIAGWLFGLASHPGGRKWRARYEAEREAPAAYRDQTEARIDALQRENTALGYDRVALPADQLPPHAPVGRAPCMERVCQYVRFSAVDVPFIKPTPTSYI